MPTKDNTARAYASGGSSRSAAFLVEIIVVLIVLGLMAATAVAAIGGLLDKAARTARSTQTGASLDCADAVAPNPAARGATHDARTTGCKETGEP